MVFGFTTLELFVHFCGYINLCVLCGLKYLPALRSFSEAGWLNKKIILCG
jgi:hypothetical protein